MLMRSEEPALGSADSAIKRRRVAHSLLTARMLKDFRIAERHSSRRSLTVSPGGALKYEAREGFRASSASGKHASRSSARVVRCGLAEAPSSARSRLTKRLGLDAAAWRKEEKSAFRKIDRKMVVRHRARYRLNAAKGLLCICRQFTGSKVFQ